jgi:hypothetical protein
MGSDQERYWYLWHLVGLTQLPAMSILEPTHPKEMLSHRVKINNTHPIKDIMLARLNKVSTMKHLHPVE